MPIIYKAIMHACSNTLYRSGFGHVKLLENMHSINEKVNKEDAAILFYPFDLAAKCSYIISMNKTANPIILLAEYVAS